MRFQVLTIFPELFERFKQVGLVGRACTEGAVSIEPIHLRDFAINTHGQIDDSPYGGGSGMVLRPDAAAAAIEHAKKNDPTAKVVLLTPRGKVFKQKLARELVAESAENGTGFIFVCCRYEGVDERVVDEWVDLELSIGDYVLMGGESASMVVIEALTRLVPGVLGNPESISHESFENELLEHPQYTKPSEFHGRTVPPVLLSGNHKEIERFREEAARRDTLERRPDLIREPGLPRCELTAGLIHYPVYNKRHEIVASSVTNMDLHDIARSSRTYGLSKYYVVHPTRALRRLSEKICEHWEVGYGATYNANRSEALRRIAVLPDLDGVVTDIEVRTGKIPKIITTSARDSEKSVTFAQMSQTLHLSDEPHLILFGTGWGLAEEVLDRADYHLEPVKGYTEYNHLSVRGAAAIIFDRLLGRRGSSTF
ncbi:MAG: tRNA (guanosine(37)-N1)-methyltransferase TrmD [Bdellovibrionota bacterium]